MFAAKIKQFLSLLLRSYTRTPQLLKTSRFRRSTLWNCMTLMLLSTTTWANYAIPTQLTLAQIGDTDTFQVTSYGCGWLGSASSSDTGIVTVSPQTSGSEPQTFTVTATGGGNAIVSVTYSQDRVAYDNGSYVDPCNLDGTVTVDVAVTVPDEGSTGNTPQSGDDGDPVNTNNGELFFYEKPDLDAGGPLPMIFQRYYASYLHRSFIEGDLGDNWRHNYEWSLHWNGTNITIISPNGRLLKYLNQSSNWVLQTNNVVSHDLFMANEGGSNYFYLTDATRDRIYKFNAEGKLIEIQNGKGASLFLTYFTAGTDLGKLQEVDDGGLKTLTFTYTTVGNVRKISTVSESYNSVQSASISFQYNDFFNEENLTGFTDVNGQSVTYSYYDRDGADTGMLQYKEYPEFNVHYTQDYFTIAESQYDSGKVESQTDAYNNTTTFSYASNSTTMTDPQSNTSSHEHSGDGELTAATDKAGNSTSLSYDANGNRANISNPLAEQLQRTYHSPSGKIASITDENGNTTSFSYTARTLSSGAVLYDLTAVSYPDGASETFSYNASGHMTTHVDRNSHSWTYTYNSLGQVLTETNPLGGTTTYTYDSANNVATMQDHATNTTTYNYVKGNRLSQVVNADTTTRDYVRRSSNASMQITSITNELNNQTTMTYDGNGNRLSITDPLTNTTSFNFDNMDRLTSVSPPLGNSLVFTYDSLGRLSIMTRVNGSTVTYGYDSLSHVNSISDSIGTVSRTFDAAGRLSSETNETGDTTQYTYDSVGNLSTVTYPTTATLSFAYDEMGRITTTTDALGNVETTSYDGEGQIVGFELADGSSTTITRNGIGGITNVADPNNNNYVRVFDTQGRVTSLTDTLLKQTTYTYTNMNRIDVATYPGGLGTLSYTYDDKGQVTRMLYSDGTDLNYQFSANNRLVSGDGFTQSRDALHKITSSNGITNTYNSSRQLTGMTLATGKTLNFTYDNRDRVTGINDNWTGLGAVTLTYDAANRLAGIVRPNGITTTYAYDADGRLSGITEGSVASIAITRNANGQITYTNVSDPNSMPAVSLTTSTDAPTFNAGYQDTAYTYDDLGRLTNDGGTRTYVWDLASRLSSYTENATTINFTYDALGHVLTRTGGEEFVWNYGTAIASPMIFRNTGVDQSYNVFTPDGRLAFRILADGTRRYYHYDASGNTWFVTNDAGTVTAFFRYSPYGEIIASSGAEASSEKFTYQGRDGVIQEGSTGLYYMRARYYDAASGNFVSRDPIDAVHPLTINAYQYARRDPINFSDVLGQTPTSPVPSAENLGKSAISNSANQLGNVAESGVRTFEHVAEATDNASLKKTMQQRAKRLRRVNGGLKVAGAAGTLSGAYNEGMKMDKAQKEAIEQFTGEAKNIMTSWTRAYEVLDLKLKKKEITRAEYWEQRAAADKFWQAQLEANSNRGMNEVMLETVKGGLRAMWQVTDLPPEPLDAFIGWLSGNE